MKTPGNSSSRTPVWGRLPILLLGGWLAVVCTHELRGEDPMEMWRIPAGGVPTGEDLRDIAYGSGLFVAVGSQGIVLYSSDAEHWSAKHVATSNNLIAVKWIDGRFVVTDGSIEWAQYGLMKSWDVTFGNGRFLALGTETGKVWTFNYLLISWDGVFWEPHLMPSYVTPSLVAYGNSRLVIIANNWTWLPATTRQILVSTSIPPPEPREVVRVNGWLSGGFGLTLHGQDGVPYQIEVSDDLEHWQEWQRVTGLFDGLLVTDPTSFFLSRRFYRLTRIVP